jgi:hypothetical protein
MADEGASSPRPGRRRQRRRRGGQAARDRDPIAPPVHALDVSGVVSLLHLTARPLPSVDPSGTTRASPPPAPMAASTTAPASVPSAAVAVVLPAAA